MPWTPIRTMRRGARPDFTILNEPGNIHVTRAQRWLTDQLIDLERRTLISGWYAHKPGYHDTVAHNDARSGVGKDYSARDPQDRRGPRNRTRAWDWTFRDAQVGNFTSFERYGDRFMAAYRAKDPRLSGWREYLGRVSTPVIINEESTKRVGIDFRHRYLRIPDSTHDWHVHASESTEYVESFENKWAFLTIAAGWTLAEWRQSTEEEDMPLTDADAAKVASAVWAHQHNHPTVTGAKQSKGTVMEFMDAVHDAKTAQVLAAIQTLGSELGKTLDVDEAAIVAGVLAGVTPEKMAEAIRQAGLTPDAIAAMIPEEIGESVASSLAARLAQ